MVSGGGDFAVSVAAGMGLPVGAGLDVGGANETTVLCSWLRWRPEILGELQILDSKFSFDVTADERDKGIRIYTEEWTGVDTTYSTHFSQDPRWAAWHFSRVFYLDKIVFIYF